MAEEKKEQYINVCFLGHVDSGKSTTIGHLSYKLGAIDKRTVDKLEETAKEFGKGSFGFAFLCDNNKAERESGITIQVSMKVVNTAKHTVNILDCPGHRGFLKNMITGTAQADVAVIIVPAAQGEFERAITETGTLYEHIVLAHTLGVSKAIVAINKLDTLGSEADAQARFNEISENIKGKMKKMYNIKTTPIVAISGFKGIGLTAEGEKFEWFKGWTPEDAPAGFTPIRSLEEAIDYYPIPKRMTESPLRIPITGVYEIKGIGRVFAGRVESGVCTAGMKVNIAPAGVVTEVKTMEIHKTARKRVEAGENCGITLKTNADIDKVKQGSVIADSANPCVKGFAAYATVIFIGKVKCIKAGYAPTMDIAATHVSTIFAQLCDIGAKKGKEFVVTTDKPTEIAGTRPCARVIIVPSKPTVMEKFSEFPFLGRFALRDMGKTIGVGIIHEVLDKAQTEARVPEYFSAGKKAAKKV